MNGATARPPIGPEEEISSLIATLLETERRLEALTGGEVDTVSTGSGQPFLLGRAQKELRGREAAKQAAILNALPAQIALLDAQGCIVSVNETWRQVGRANLLQSPAFGVGLNYVKLCDAVRGEARDDAQRIAAGIRAVLLDEKMFSLEYPCHTPVEQRWFQLTVTPQTEDRVRGAVVMHMDITARKRAEAALAELLRTTAQRERRLMKMLSHISDFTYVYDRQGRFIFANQPLLDLWGRTLDEVIGRNFSDLGYPDDLARRLQREVQEVFETGRRITGETSHTGRSGIPAFYAYIFSPALAADGSVEFVVGSSRDISASRRATQLLLEGRERLSLAAESARLGIWEWDMMTKQLVWDAKMHQIYGISEQDFSGTYDAWKKSLHPEDRPRAESELLAAVDGDKGFHTEFRIRWPSGEVRVIEAHAVMHRTRSGTATRMVGVNWDITDRKRIADELSTSEKRFKALFDQAATGVGLIDVRSGRYVQVNLRFCEITGRSRQELEELTFAEITHPQDVDRQREKMRQLSAGEFRESAWEKRFLRKDGTEVWVNLTMSAMWSPGETPDHIIVVAQDITERKSMEEQLRQAQKMDAIGTLAGGIAHDFNNVLAAINGYAELSLLQLKENPEVREYLDSVLKASGRAADLVRQILSFSRQERPKRQAIALRPIVEEACKLLRASVPSTIEFALDLAPDTPAVLADSTQIHQILMNLGTNAWHAMANQPGRLHVSLEAVVVDEAQAAMEARLQPGLFTRLSVGDTGCGMEPATLRRIFEPFFTTKPVGRGTGLGLAVVHGIMASHDGAVTVHSEPGSGTVFHLYFPAHLGDVTTVTHDTGPTPLGHGERVLLVDDEELLTTLGQMTLTALGYAVEVAQDPAVALAWIRAEPARFALVITDETMPGMTGLVLAGELRRIRPALPIILMTGYDLALTPERIQAAGIREVLLKPTTLHALGTAAHAALSAPAAA